MRWLTEIVWRLLTKGDPYRINPQPTMNRGPAGRNEETSRKAA